MLSGYAKSVATSNVSDKASLLARQPWIGNEPNLVNLVYSIDNYHNARVNLYEMIYKQKHYDWNGGYAAYNWELRAYDILGDEDNFKQVTTISNRLRLETRRTNKNAKKKEYSILDKTISSAYDYIYDDEALFSW